MADYNLDALGWFQFERLCQSLLKSKCGLAVEAWGRNGDHGRDAYSEEPLRFPAQELTNGPFIFQVKFVSAANAAGSDPMPGLRDGVHKELARIQKRRESNQWSAPRRYCLLTNVSLNADQREVVKKLLKVGLPKSQILIQDGSDISALLDDSPQVRLAFPQILGLRDIFELLDQRVNRDILKRSSLAVEISSDRATSFVATEAYGRALNVLTANRFVVLTGPPEMGKTTIAWMIALARLSGGWEAYECRSPEDFFRVHDPERRQIFVVDDAFGSTEYQPDRANLWADELEKVLRALDNGHWLLLTSRPAPLKQALERLNVKGGGEEFPDPNQVLVDASQLSVQEKAQMLYRHAKSGLKDQAGRDLIKGGAVALVNHEHFTPLRIQRFVNKQVPAILASPEAEREDLMAVAVNTNLETATLEMTTSFRQLPEDCKVLLISMLDTNESSVYVDDLSRSFKRHLGGIPERSAEATAKVIDDHFIRIVAPVSDPSEPPLEPWVEWVHPSVRDLVIDHLMSDAQARLSFLGKTGIDGLMLALSSEGGAGGDRLFPLLQSEEDWLETAARIVTLPADADGPLENSRLAALLADTARLAKSEEASEHADDLKALTRSGLEALRTHWSDSDLILGNGELRSFYRASASLLPPVPGPDLTATWLDRWRSVVAGTTGSIIEEIGAAERWLDLANLLEDYEPLWLKALSFPAAYAETFEGIIEEIDAEQRSIDPPRVTESEDLSEYAAAPPDLTWMSTAEDLIDTIERFDPSLGERYETLPGQMEEASSDWREYRENHEEWVALERGERDEDYDERYREEVEVFDLRQFFSDL
jgi:hypothetical protein